MKRTTVLGVLIGLAAMSVVGCASATSSVPTSAPTSQASGESCNPTIDPASFVTTVDNPYFPLAPDTTFLHQGETEHGAERNQVVVARETKQILGVTCVVVKDRVWLNDDLVEETINWYAQDKDGNVWYFGEDSKEYENGVVVSTKGSWETGVDGAMPGIIMEASPRVNDSYRQECKAGEAEDMGKVLSLNESASVPFGSFEGCLKIQDWTPLEPGITEHKYYCQGVGPVLTIMVEGGSERHELVSRVTE
jgi:hypothetical protein